MTKTLAKACLYLMLTTLAGTALCQTVAPVKTPFAESTLPAPIEYPPDFLRPQFDKTSHEGERVSLGFFDIELGKTGLSVVAKTLGAELQFTAARTGFFCFSAPAPMPAIKGKKKSAEEPVDYQQNIWLIVGKKGLISEVRASRVTENDELCPRLPEEYERVRIGSFYINEPVKKANHKKSHDTEEPSAYSEDPNWRYWFSMIPRGKMAQIGLLGVLDEEAFVTRIVSVVETIKGF